MLGSLLRVFEICYFVAISPQRTFLVQKEILLSCSEIKVENLHSSSLIESLAEFSVGPVDLLSDIAFVKKGRSAVKHLFSVGCGLDSQIIGDFEIIGQVKKAFALSLECASSKAFLDRLVSLVIKASKRIKSETV